MPSALAANLDYALFSLSALAVFGVLAWQLPRVRKGAALPRYVWPLLAIVLTAGWFPVRWMGEQEARQIAELVGANAPTYARELARLGHAAIAADVTPDDPRYQQLQRVTDEWLADNRHAHDIYTVRRLPDGRRVFVIDSDTDYDRDGSISEREQGAAPGDEYEEADPALDRALDGEGSFDFQPITDRWGTWVGAWAPIRDADGRVEAVVGVDYDAREWFAAISKARLDRIAQLGLLLAIIAATGAAIGLLRADLSARARVEDELRRANERWNLIVEQMPLAFIEFDSKAKVLAWNPAAERTFGYKAADTLGRQGLDMIVPQQLRKEIDTVVQRLLKKSGGMHSVNENLTKDGRIILCEWFNTPVVDRAGNVVSIISLTQDVTARRSLEQQMQQAQKMEGIGLLAAGIAHDFNNILTIVHGHAELLLGRDDLPLEAVEDIGRIADAADRAATLTRQLLTFSRRQAMFAEPINLNDTVSTTASMLGRILGARIRIDCHLDPDLPVVEADPAMLQQVLTNLAVNARDAMPEGGTLTLTTQGVKIDREDAAGNPEARPGPAVCLSVSDTGMGIEREILPNIFEPFFTTKEVGKGTGLGLAAAHGIVQQHSGWIVVNSTVGKGTCFEIFLPCDATVASRKQTASPEVEPMYAA